MNSDHFAKHNHTKHEGRAYSPQIVEGNQTTISFAIIIIIITKFPAPKRAFQQVITSHMLQTIYIYIYTHCKHTHIHTNKHKLKFIIISNVTLKMINHLKSIQ